jgi:diaminohydroxyphosphoribosylaminopyrimidine deaminase/5-amino-6-(5-phosphoribosylamino)uracil reductase
MVGCVIVYKNRIIGEGFHRSHGGPHAEVHAVGQVREKELLQHSTVYVSLEPCAHQGLTPPCAELLVHHSVKRVVICNTDPNPRVSGRGIEILEKSGIEVKTDLLKNQGRSLNRRFFTYHEKKRPYIILKWARTSDGFIARKDYSSKWISNAWSRKLVHKWRAEEDAILVGRQTAFSDNPSLTVRNWEGKNPLRLVIDPKLKLPPSLRLFDDVQPTVCYNYIRSSQEGRTTYIKCREADFLSDMLKDLYQRSVLSVLVEGGSKTLQRFINADLWDEARVFTSDALFEEGVIAPVLRDAILVNKEHIMGDQLQIYRHDRGDQNK